MVPHRCTPRARRALSGWAHVSYCTFTGQQCNAQRPLSSARPQLSTSLQLRRRWLRRRCGCKPPRVRATCAARARASQSTSAHTSNTRQAKSTQGRLRRSVGGCRPRNNTKHAKHNSSFLKSALKSACEFGRLQGGVRARGAALWPWLLLRRWRVCCDCHGGGRAWRGGCARGSCVVCGLGAAEG